MLELEHNASIFGSKMVLSYLLDQRSAAKTVVLEQNIENTSSRILILLP